METARRARMWPALGLLAALAFAGCGPGPEGDVEGKVLFDGREAASGIVTFVGADGKAKSAVIHGGAYRVTGVAVGEAKIGVANHMRAPAGLLTPSGPDAQPHPPEEKTVVIPERYERPQSSGLTFTVKNGTQTHNIELPP